MRGIIGVLTLAAATAVAALVPGASESSLTLSSMLAGSLLASAIVLIARADGGQDPIIQQDESDMQFAPNLSEEQARRNDGPMA